VKAFPNVTQYKEHQKNTEILKPSIFNGLPSNCILGISGCFEADLMHLVSLNLINLVLFLWHEILDCDKNVDKLMWDFAVLIGET
jgi:hypothetical protein